MTRSKRPSVYGGGLPEDRLFPQQNDLGTLSDMIFSERSYGMENLTLKEDKP